MNNDFLEAFERLDPHTAIQILDAAKKSGFVDQETASLASNVIKNRVLEFIRQAEINAQIEKQILDLASKIVEQKILELVEQADLVSSIQILDQVKKLPFISEKTITDIEQIIEQKMLTLVEQADLASAIQILDHIKGYKFVSKETITTAKQIIEQKILEFIKQADTATAIEFLKFAVENNFLSKKTINEALRIIEQKIEQDKGGPLSIKLSCFGIDPIEIRRIVSIKNGSRSLVRIDSLLDQNGSAELSSLLTKNLKILASPVSSTKQKKTAYRNTAKIFHTDTFDEKYFPRPNGRELQSELAPLVITLMNDLQ